MYFHSKNSLILCFFFIPPPLPLSKLLLFYWRSILPVNQHECSSICCIISVFPFQLLCSSGSFFFCVVCFSQSSLILRYPLRRVCEYITKFTRIGWVGMFSCQGMEGFFWNSPLSWVGVMEVFGWRLLRASRNANSWPATLPGGRDILLWEWRASVTGILTCAIPQTLQFFKIAIKHNESNEKNRVKDKLLKIPSTL